MPCITSYLSNAAQCTCKQGKEGICGEKEREGEGGRVAPGFQVNAAQTV